MNTRITKEIAEAVKQHGRPLVLEDSAGALYYVLTGEQFRQYVYDDSDLTDDEMIAAASYLLDELERGEPGVPDVFDEDDAGAPP